MAETLKFHFTPVDPPRADRDNNPHAKATTHTPEVVEALKAEFGDVVEEVSQYAGETTVRVAAARIVDVCSFLKAEQGFNYLADLGGVDRFTETDRFEVFYNLVSMTNRKRLRVVIRVDEDHLEVDSITGVWRAANWNEREVYDMLGIRFKGHEDLRRMFMPEDFEHYPQRKEFPLLGIPGSLPLPANTPEGEHRLDPFPSAHGDRPVNSFEEPASLAADDEDDD